MKYGFPSLLGPITEPAAALDAILNSYFNSDTTGLGLDVRIRSLRSDMIDGNDIAGNIEDSLKYILPKYFEQVSVNVTEGESEGNMQYMEVAISITDDGRVINFENVLNIEGGSLKSIEAIGHL